MLTRNKTALGLLGATLIYLVLAVGIARTKTPWCDEGWLACPAYNLATLGMMGTTVVEPQGYFLNANLKGIQQRTYVILPLQPVTLAGWFRVFGFSLMTMRLYGILWGFLALMALFLIVRTLLRDSSVALLATVIAAADFTFLWGAADGRMDMMCTALGLSAQAAYLLLRPRHFTVALLVSHSLMAAAFLTHPNAFLAFVALVYLTLHFDRRRLRWVHVVVVAAPYLTGLSAWGIYILQSPSDFLAQFSANAAGRGGVRYKLLTQPWSEAWRELLGRYAAHYGLLPKWTGPTNIWQILVPFTYFAVLIHCLVTKSMRGDPGVRTVLMLLGICMLCMTFLLGSKEPQYLVYIVPLYDAVLAIWLLWQWRRGGSARKFAAGLVAALVLIQVGTAIQKIRENPYENEYRPVVRFLERHTKSGMLITATAAIGFDISYDRFVDDIRLGFHSGRKADWIVLDHYYQRWFEELFKTGEPTVYRYVTGMLNNEYHVVFQSGDFKVLRRNTPRPAIHEQATSQSLPG